MNFTSWIPFPQVANVLRTTPWSWERSIETFGKLYSLFLSFNCKGDSHKSLLPTISRLDVLRSEIFSFDLILRSAWIIWVKFFDFHVFHSGRHCASMSRPDFESYTQSSEIFPSPNRPNFPSPNTFTFFPRSEKKTSKIGDSETPFPNSAVSMVRYRDRKIPISPVRRYEKKALRILYHEISVSKTGTWKNSEFYIIMWPTLSNWQYYPFSNYSVRQTVSSGIWKNVTRELQT